MRADVGEFALGTLRRLLASAAPGKEEKLEEKKSWRRWRPGGRGVRHSINVCSSAPALATEGTLCHLPVTLLTLNPITSIPLTALVARIEHQKSKHLHDPLTLNKGHCNPPPPKTGREPANYM